MKLTPIYLQVATIAITGVVKSFADDTASGLDPTIVPTVSPAPTSTGTNIPTTTLSTISPAPTSTGTNIPTTIVPTLSSSDTASDIPSSLSSDTVSDVPSSLSSDEVSDLPSISTLPTTSTRSDQEDSGAMAAATTGLFGMLLLSMGLI